MIINLTASIKKLGFPIINPSKPLKGAVFNPFLYLNTGPAEKPGEYMQNSVGPRETAELALCLQPTGKQTAD